MKNEAMGIEVVFVIGTKIVPHEFLPVTMDATQNKVQTLCSHTIVQQ